MSAPQSSTADPREYPSRAPAPPPGARWSGAARKKSRRPTPANNAAGDTGRRPKHATKTLRRAPPGPRRIVGRQDRQHGKAERRREGEGNETDHHGPPPDATVSRAV